MVWIQYSLSDGSQEGTLDHSLSGNDLNDLIAKGCGQIEYDGDPDDMMVDITQNPPVIIPMPPSPSPAPPP